MDSWTPFGLPLGPLEAPPSIQSNRRDFVAYALLWRVIHCGFSSKSSPLEFLAHVHVIDGAGYCSSSTTWNSEPQYSRHLPDNATCLSFRRMRLSLQRVSASPALRGGLQSQIRVQPCQRRYAFQAAGAPVFDVFNRKTKWLQRERAALDPETSRRADYLRDEVAARLC